MICAKLAELCPRGMATAIGAAGNKREGGPRNVPCYFPANALAGKNFPCQPSSQKDQMDV